MQVRFSDARIISGIKQADDVDVIARITNASQIVELALLRDAIRGVSIKPGVRLILPYLPYARADRRFTDGDCLGIATFGKLVFNMDFEEIVCLDVHSPVAQNWMMIRNVVADPFVTQAINAFAQKCGSHAINVLLPDEGSLTRYKIPASTGCNNFAIDVEVFNASKVRDAESGKLSGFTVPPMPCHPTIIVDDICDGGGTFIGIAEKLSGVGDLALYTTHGIYSKEFNDLGRYFKYFYTTNSFREGWSAAKHLAGDKLTVMDCIPTLLIGAE